MPHLQLIDWSIIAAFFVVVIGIGVWASRSAGKSSSEFFLGGRGMPWWLLGVSMVACTFSADTPNLVAGMVRENGVSKNWAWWAFLITGMVTVFIYAKLWRRSGVMTDLEFYELRYGGKPASFLRGFRAVYLGVFFNILIMATVTLAIIKYGSIMFGVERWEAVVYGSVGVVIYATLGGIKGCIWADFFQYGIAMFGAVYAGYVAVGEAGRAVAKEAGKVGQKAIEYASDYSVSDLLSDPRVVDKINIFPDFTDASQWIPLLLMPIAVQWWAAWYPGAEPGGGGYIAQRMLSAKDEKNAIGATLFFNFAHYALRPWPWIIVALASLIAFPMDTKQEAKVASELLKTPAFVQLAKDVNTIKATPKSERTEAQLAKVKKLMKVQLTAKRVSSIGKAFPHIEDETVMAQDISYPAMISRLKPGFLGLVIASIIAAYMSTIGTHLNWGSSYAVNDFYKRFVNPKATEKQMVAMGRYCTVGFMVLAGTLACYLESATQAFNILLLSGAGSGAIYLLRWFWWRISAWSEIFAMVVTTIVAVVLVLFVKDEDIAFGVLDGYSVKFLIAVVATTIAWLAGTFLTKPESEETLRAFVRKCHPGGPGWAKVVAKARAEGDFIDEKIHGQAWEMPVQILCVFLGCVAIYCALFSIGSFLYGNLGMGITLGVIAVLSTVVLFKSFGKLKAE